MVWTQFLSALVLAAAGGCLLGGVIAAFFSPQRSEDGEGTEGSGSRRRRNAGSGARAPDMEDPGEGESSLAEEMELAEKAYSGWAEDSDTVDRANQSKEHSLLGLMGIISLVLDRSMPRRYRSKSS